MATRLALHTGQFGMLHFCPNPERGERVCVALWIDDGQRVSIEYDESSLARLRCIAPNFDVRMVKMLLDDLSLALQEAPRSGLDFVMKQYEPQLVATEARRL